MVEPQDLAPANIAKFLQEAGYMGKLETAGKSIYVLSGAEGWNFSVRFFNETPEAADQKCDALQFWAYWPIKDEVEDLIKTVANDFNGEIRYGTAFVRATDGKIWGEITLDHLAPDGIPSETFLRLLSIFVDLRRIFYQKSKDSRDAAVAASRSEDGSDSDDGTPTTH
jgi:hypothetical protein